MDNVVARSWRGEIVESLIRAHIAVADIEGNLLYATGDPSYVTYWRSSSKPIQALPLVESGAVDALGLSEEELSVVCASHNGEDFHTDAVRSILKKASLSEDALQCGSHPIDRSFHRRDLPDAAEPLRIHSNCSGKHAGMLAVSQHMKWPIGSYRDPLHPLQQQNLRNLAELSDYPADQICIGIDGCGVPVFSMPIRNIALAFARLAHPVGLPSSRQDALARIRDAMMAYPHMVGGTNRFDSDLMRGAAGSVVSKGGAAALQAIGLPNRGIGIAVKIEDADASYIAPTSIAVLEQLGALSAPALESLKKYREFESYINTHDELVGHTETTLMLQSTIAK